jgi:hypothetical protein
MLASSAILLGVAALAQFCVRAGSLTVGWLALLLSLFASVLSWGLVQGPLVGLCVWMVTAPALVLMFPLRGPHLERVGIICGALGALLLAGGVLT